ncbi:MAG: VanW family protein [Lachnospiraceae bacterium]|nr:VanW family protein [Lachnospiraceae bacterium]
MKKLYKALAVAGVAGTVALAAMGGVYGVNYYTEQKEARAAEAEIKRREAIVGNRSEVSYGNKTLGSIDLSGMTVEEIITKLKAESKAYKDRKVKVTVDGRKYKFSMKELGEKIFYKASDGTKFQPGDEEKLAEVIVNMDKDRDMQEQYNIITGKASPSEYSVNVKCQYDKKKLEKFIKKLEKNHVKAVTNARITKSGVITEPQNGRSLKLDKIKDGLKEYLQADTKENYNAKYKTKAIKPEWKKDDLKKVNTVISEFSTSFISTSSRGHNIQVGASRINGTFLLPGEQVSFDKVIHDSSDGQSFQAAGSYLNGKVVQTEGGGICQVSTTAYNALLLAGIIPVRRLPHSMTVHYVPLGLDAAISEGVKDLIVENKYDVPIIIKAFTEGSTLTFQIVSYKGVLGDYTYKPRSVPLSSLKAEAYLDIYKNGKLKESKFLHTDTYREAS